MSVSVPAAAEPICIVRLDVPRCSRVFGVAPCTATGEPCYQTSATCKDPVNFANDTPLSLYFGIPGQTRPTDDIAVLPFLRAWPDTTAARVNVAGADRRVSPLGLRATATLEFHDAQHTDRGIDPYRASRSYDPMAQGSFWARFEARHLYQRHLIGVTIYQGFAGDALADMVQRVYVFKSLDFSAEDRAQINCVDPLERASGDKAQIPAASPGYLSADIDASVTTINVVNAVAADYPASGTFRIGDEVMTYAARADVASGVDFTGIVRGTDGTVPDDHDAEAAVQECWRLSDVSVDAALVDLFGRTPIDPAFIPSADWATEVASYISSYVLRGLVTQPTPAADLIGEICEQTQTFLWWDEALQEIRLSAVKPLIDAAPKTITDAEIIAGSLTLRQFPDRRVSRAVVYYQQRDPTESVTKKSNYARVQLTVDLQGEGDERFGETAVREVFARFLASEPVAKQTAGRLVRRYANGAREVSFALSDRHADLGVGEVFYLRNRRVQTASGAQDAMTLWIVTQRRVIAQARRVEYVAEDATLAGRVYRIAPTGTQDYQGNGADDQRYAWIAGPTGQMSDGAPGYRIQ